MPCTSHTVAGSSCHPFGAEDMHLLARVTIDFFSGNGAASLAAKQQAHECETNGNPIAGTLCGASCLLGIVLLQLHAPRAAAAAAACMAYECDPTLQLLVLLMH